MLVSRLLMTATLGAAAVAAMPASAQFYLKPPEISAPRITGTEPGMLAQVLTGATPAELRAAKVWNLRAALNVAALQCQFGPTMLTLNHYNAILSDHRVELADSYATLTKYFARTNKTPRAGQMALDQYGTRVYSSYSAVHGQLSFCMAANRIGAEAVFTPRGKLGDLAADRLASLRLSITRWGEQQFPGSQAISHQIHYPNFTNAKCWRKDVYSPERCGAPRL